MSVKDQMIADGPIFVDPDVFGEAITYIQAGALPMAINAVIQRGDPEKIMTIGGRPYPGLVIQLEIPVASLARVKERADTVLVMFRPEDLTPTTFRITKIREQDEGMWSLEAEA